MLISRCYPECSSSAHETDCRRSAELPEIPKHSAASKVSTGHKYVSNVRSSCSDFLAAALAERAPDCCWCIPPTCRRSRNWSATGPAPSRELYDDQNRVIGQFALQRRVIDKYDDFPKVLRDAIISTEDKDFEQPLGSGCLARLWRGLSRLGLRQRARRALPR